ncbi:MAG: hypothetical protein ACYC4U_11340 [Pirellulaceae bacterium]
MILAQIPGADAAINSAAAEGWVAVLLVVLVLSGFASFGYVIKQILADARERERALNGRIDELQGFIRTTLVGTLEEGSAMTGKMLNAVESICRAADRMTGTLERFSAVMEVQPCLAMIQSQRAKQTTGEA